LKHSGAAAHCRRPVLRNEVIKTQTMRLVRLEQFCLPSRR
jgi:hypothetical protein